MPSKASRRRDCCWVSARVRDLSPLNMIGSEPSVRQCWCLTIKVYVDRETSHTVGDDNAVFPFNGLVRDSFGQVHC